MIFWRHRPRHRASRYVGRHRMGNVPGLWLWEPWSTVSGSSAAGFVSMWTDLELPLKVLRTWEQVPTSVDTTLGESVKFDYAVVH